MEEQQKASLQLLLVGRIYEEQQVLKYIIQIINTFEEYAELCHFYFLDSKTIGKVISLQPELSSKCHVFAQYKHIRLTYLITVGGDGTILYAAKELTDQSPPILAFQRGTLGFMCRFKISEINQVIKDAVACLKLKPDSQQFPFQPCRTMRIESRKRTIGKQQFEPSKVSLNEVFISRPTCQRVILEIWVNGELMTQTAGDGVLISTPTGSTAYSLSAGGPLMQNGVNAILIVPIAPNSLSFRPICLPSDCQIILRISKKSRSQGYLSYDGQTNDSFTHNDELVIKKFEQDISFYQYGNQKKQLPTWMKRLKQFLGWNQSFKNNTENLKTEQNINNQNSSQKQLTANKQQQSNIKKQEYKNLN